MATLILWLNILAVLLLADFVTGLAHWFEDAYARDEWPVIGPLIARPNIIHHHDPRRILRSSWWSSTWLLLCIAASFALGAWLLGCLNWQVGFFAVVISQTDVVHKWSHGTRAENGPVISWLQDLRLLQTPQHHAQHHTDPKNSYYCALTNLLNLFWIVRTSGMVWSGWSGNSPARAAGPTPPCLDTVPHRTGCRCRPGRVDRPHLFTPR